ncbi:protein TolA [Chromatium okenii]|uniref:cell envelope integrity protein TolA n=1 Tax=Chromatium okenii TaxID=61644 RepID=UPI001908F674|nr:cell envelope integrity protein TolA [Chromatium okenii]MBK1640555.1 protein TolA [Chromatium okenii]
MLWRFLPAPRAALLWSVALHLAVGLALLLGMWVTPPPVKPQVQVVTARLVGTPRPLPPAAPIRQSEPERPAPAESTRAAAQRLAIEQERQAANARAAAQRDADAAAQRLAIEQERQAANARAVAQRDADAAAQQLAIEQERQAANARAAAQLDAELAAQQMAIEQERQEQQQLETELAQLAAVEEQRFAEDLAKQQRELPPLPAAPDAPEADLLAALAAEQMTREADQYVPLIQERVRQFWVRPLASGRDFSAVVALRLLPGGEVIPNSVRIVTSSTNAAFDQSAIAAVYQASPLPVPTGAAFAPFRDFYFTFSPE